MSALNLVGADSFLNSNREYYNLNMKYAINKEFGIFRKFKPPLNKLIFRLALIMPKGLRHTKTVTVAKYKVSVADGRKIPLYIFSPENVNGKLPVIVYFHGGGFVFKGAPYHYKLAKIYAEKANAKVVFVDYRLAFQGKYLMPLSDCVSAYRFVLENADNLKVNVNNIGVVGDSAGGYLSLALIKTLAMNGMAVPKYQMLIYPVVDPEMKTNSMSEYADTPMWNSKANAIMWKLYSHGNTVYNPLRDDLSFMPPTYIETAEYDCLRDEGIELHDKLNECGVACSLFQTNGTMHGFDICLSAKTTQKSIEHRINILKQFQNN